MRNNRNRLIGKPIQKTKSFSAIITHLNVKKIFKILTYIYYYEIDENKFIKPEQKFYLINYDWMQKLKNFSSYQDLSKILKPLKGEKETITYNNLSKFINAIINVLMEKKIKFRDEEEFKELSKAGNFKPDEIENEKINTSPNYYLIPSELNEKFEECIFDGKSIIMDHTYNLSTKDNFILLKEEKVIKICTIDNKFKVIIRYIITFKSYFIKDLEINNLEKDIEKYIKERGCQLNNYFIQELKKNGEKIGQLNILENNGTKDKLIKGRKNFISKLNTRNQDGDLKKEYYSERNSPRKKEINIFSNNENAQSNNNYNNTLKNINKNTIRNNNNFKIHINNDNNKNIYKDNKNEEENNLPTFKKNSFERQVPKLDVNIKKHDEPEDRNNIKNMNFFDKNKDEKIKYDNILNLIEKQFENVNKKLGEVIAYNKQLELNLNKKMDKIIESQNDINQLTKKLNECMNTIEQLKEENKKLKIEKEIKKENNNNINNNIDLNPNQNIQFRNIQTKNVLEQIQNKKDIIKKKLQKKEIILIGLKDIGQSAFINPLIQSLFYTESLSNHFKKINLNKNNPKLKLAISFQELIIQLSDKNTKNLSPKNFINTINDIESEKNVSVINANNSIYDFLKFILNQLHQELKEDINNKNKIGLKFLNEINSNTDNEKSIITDLFQIVGKNIYLCCEKNLTDEKYKLEKMLYLSFYLGNDELNNEKLSVKNCLVKMRQKLFYTNNEYCEICDKYCNILHKHKFSICPKVLIIMLNYTNEPNFINSNLEEQLDITNFTKCENDKFIDKQIYNLYGVISKINNNFEIKYVASCKNYIDNNWYKFDDENIQIVEDINNAINYGITLILFYSKAET